jgi:DNA polymerase III sliding clamp (beta) subunit (PCNA family)
MKLVADGAALAEAARFVNGVVPGKPHEAELGGMLIDVRDWSDGHVTASFACYDYYTSGSSVIETTGGEPGKVLVSARLLTDVLANAAKRGEVTLANQPGDLPGRLGGRAGAGAGRGRRAGGATHARRGLPAQPG